jgi:hypothetical protein
MLNLVTLVLPFAFVALGFSLKRLFHGPVASFYIRSLIPILAAQAFCQELLIMNGVRRSVHLVSPGVAQELRSSYLLYAYAGTGLMIIYSLVFGACVSLLLIYSWRPRFR